ncbi:restriction endonuclease subunit S [Rhodococcus sp. SJ-3]|uniref:restriction endonuclease subunit S n=1 Tax=Rhodococcus sp. SJ-3 TaxID=3454628 RepID=UPI003F7A3EBC
MSEWPTLPLGDVATLQRGYDLPVQNRVAGPIPVFAANGPVGFHSVTKVDGPGVVTGRSGSIGKVHHVDGGFWPLNTSLFVKDFHGNDTRYIYYLLGAMRLEQYCTGTGVPTLNRNIVHEVSVPVPPVAAQRRIAAILDHADALRTKRREALARLDELTQSIFIDMFGDPISNDRGWPVGFVSDFVDGFEGGRNIVGSDDQGDGYRVLKVSAVTSLAYRESESKPLPSDYVPPSNHLVREGDLLFSRANTSELVGATAIVTATDGKTALPDKLWRFKWHDESAAVPRYIESLFQRPSFRRRLSERATGSSGSMKNISQAKVLTISIGLPPLELQCAFAQRKEAIELMKENERTALTELDALFSSLQARAFRGEL